MALQSDNTWNLTTDGGWLQHGILERKDELANPACGISIAVAVTSAVLFLVSSNLCAECLAVSCARTQAHPEEGRSRRNPFFKYLDSNSDDISLWDSSLDSDSAQKNRQSTAACTASLVANVTRLLLYAVRGASATGTVLGITAAAIVCKKKKDDDDPDIDLVVLDPGPRIPDVMPPTSGLPDDGCGDSSARSSDGRCYPVLKKGPCSSTEWITVDPNTLKAMCRPRLCGPGRVFVGRDGLCHDIFDPIECTGGRRLYYSAYGDPVCDCPVGQYPFPDGYSGCVRLFTQGPCPYGQVIAFSPSGTLSCQVHDCPMSEYPLLRNPADGLCYSLGTPGPCGYGQIFAYDVFRRQAVCTSLTSTKSPYAISSTELELLNRNYNQVPPDHPSYVVILQTNETASERQDSGTTSTPGILQFPMLNPCAAGIRGGNNFKCTNPLAPQSQPASRRRAVLPRTQCAPGFTLMAVGECRAGASLGAATCGPSYTFVAALSSCRQSLAALRS